MAFEFGKMKVTESMAPTGLKENSDGPPLTTYVLQMKNALIDLLDGFSGSLSDGERWTRAEDICRDQGLSHLLISRIDEASNTIGWINTNMPDAWMAEYIERDFASVDPFLTSLAGRVGHMRLTTGQMTKDDAPSQKAYDLNHGMTAHDLRFLHCSRFGEPGGLGTYVTFSSPNEQNETEQSQALDIDILAAVLATQVLAPVENVSNQLLGHVWLSPRQKEVLQLLAEGLQTTQIADKLRLSEVTVRKHFTEARIKLGASTRSEAMAIAMQRGLIAL